MRLEEVIIHLEILFILVKMTDERLINKAHGTQSKDWDSINSLIDLASDEETKRILEIIQKRKFHEDEFKDGNL